MWRALLFVAIALPAGALAEPFGPFRTKAAPVTSDARVAVRPSERLPSADPLWFAYRIYQETLSSQDGPRCGHYPTCSMYGVQMVRRRPVLGFFLTVDRLWRGDRSSRLRLLPTTYLHGVGRHYDPIDNADFWLRDIPSDRAPEYLPTRPRQ